MRSLVVTALLWSMFAWCEATDGQFPDISSLVLDSYQFKSEITIKGNGNDQDDSSSGYVDEYFDITEDIGRLNIVQGGDSLNVFYNKNLKEISVVTKSDDKVDCAVAPWDKRSEVLQTVVIWGWEETYGDGRLVFGPSALFHTINKANQKPVYRKRTTVRGILVNEYTVKINKYKDITFTLHMTVERWTNPYTGNKGKQIPVRISANGQDNGQMVNYTVDISNFQNYVDMSTLDLPVGIGCYGINSVMPVPTLPSSFSFIAEVYNLTQEKDQVENFASLQKVWYIGDSKYSRIDIYNNVNNGVAEIHDFNTGVMFSFDDNQQCSVQPLITSEFEKNDNIVRLMKTPNDIFHLDDTTYYLGKAFTRGINCDVYETVVFDFAKSEASKPIFKVVFTLYFTTTKWVDVLNGMVENQVPVKMLITAYNKDLSMFYKMEYNIFKFAETLTPDSMEYFNVGNCFPSPKDRQYIEMYMQADKKTLSLALNKSEQVKEDIFGYLVSRMSLSPLRIPYLRVDFEDDKILARVQILQRLDAIQSFQAVPNNGVPNSNEKKITLKLPSAELCAQECLKMENSACRSFHSCDQNCFLSLFPKLDPCSGGKDCLTNYTGCQYYIKAEFNETGLQPSLEDVLQVIEESVKKGSFIIPLRDNDKKEVLLKVSSVKRINPYTSLDKDVDRFRVTWPFKSLPSAGDDETVMDGINVNSRFDCYRRCDSESSISCLTFSFCDDTKECRLSSKNWTGDSLTQNTHCRVFSVSTLKLFDKLEGKIVAGAGDERATATSAEACAQICRSKRDSMPCRGFEFCETRKTCVLHKRHYLDLDPRRIVDSNARCDHYALKFSQDFVPTGRLYIKEKKPLVIDQISEEDCAKRCSENQNFDCKSFTYCSDKDDPSLSKAKCSIYSLSQFDDKVETSDAPDNCQMYTRNDNAIFQDKPAELQTTSKGYTSGGLTGLIFGMLFLGLALGAAGFLGYSYYRLRKNDDGVTVRFVKNDNL